MFHHVEVHGGGPEHQRQQEEDEAEVSHLLPLLGALALVTVPDLLDLPDHVVREEDAHIGREDQQDGGGQTLGARVKAPVKGIGQQGKVYQDMQEGQPEPRGIGGVRTVGHMFPDDGDKLGEAGLYGSVKVKVDSNVADHEDVAEAEEQVEDDLADGGGDVEGERL